MVHVGRRGTGSGTGPLDGPVPIPVGEPPPGLMMPGDQAEEPADNGIGEVDTVTQPGSWSALPTVAVICGASSREISLHGAYRIVSSTGTYTYNPVLGSSNNWAEVLAAYK